MKKEQLLAFLCVVFSLGLGMVARAEPPPRTEALMLHPRGYLSFNYLYLGSASSETVYHGFRLNGNFQLDMFHNRVTFVFRSRHYWHIQKTSAFLYSRSFENRNLVRDVYIEVHDLITRGSRIRLGRFYPSVAAGMLYPIDGVQIETERGSVSLRFAGGLPVDAWDNRHLTNGRLMGGSLTYTSRQLIFSFGATFLNDEIRSSKEMAADLHVQVSPGFWLTGGGAYDFQFKETTRYYGGLSYRTGPVYLMFSYNSWQNPWQQLHLDDLAKRLPFFGRNALQPPVRFQDIRGRFSVRFRRWQVDMSLARFLGVRSGWMGLGRIGFPRIARFRGQITARALRSDYFNFYTLGGSITAYLSSIEVEISSEARAYQRLPTTSGFRFTENLTEINLTAPIGRHWYIRLSGGAYFRRIGNESTKPFSSVRVLYRF